MPAKKIRIVRKIVPFPGFGHQAAIDRFWRRLSAGGHPGRCGWREDKFGGSWPVVPTRLIDWLQDPGAGKVSRGAPPHLP